MSNEFIITENWFRKDQKVRCIKNPKNNKFIPGKVYTVLEYSKFGDCPAWNSIEEEDGNEIIVNHKEIYPCFELVQENIVSHPKQDIGLKYDQGKPPMSLLATGWLQGVANALGFGAKKYGPYNWRNGIEQSRLIDAAMRHITAYNNGEDVDPESGLSHLYHASCNLMFASELLKSHPELDDRYKK